MSDIKLELQDSMGNLDSVANSARCSFGKKASDYSHTRNVGLVKYLAKNNHWTPFCSLYASVLIELPLYIHAQLVKHTVGGVVNTMSRRYVRDEVSFYTPSYRSAPTEGVKQGSGGDMSPCQQQEAARLVKHEEVSSLTCYNNLLLLGVCPEQARGVLPQAAMTKCVVSGSAIYFDRILTQRQDSSAQREWLTICTKLDESLKEAWPEVWPILRSKGND